MNVTVLKNALVRTRYSNHFLSNYTSIILKQWEGTLCWGTPCNPPYRTSSF